MVRFVSVEDGLTLEDRREMLPNNEMQWTSHSPMAARR